MVPGGPSILSYRTWSGGTGCGGTIGCVTAPPPEFLLSLHCIIIEIVKWVSRTYSYTVDRSSTAVKLKVNGQFEIFSKVNGQATTFRD